MATELLFTDPDGDGEGDWSSDTAGPTGDFATKVYLYTGDATLAAAIAVANAAISDLQLGGSVNSPLEIELPGGVMKTRPTTNVNRRVNWISPTAPAGGGYPNAVGGKDSWTVKDF